MYAGSLYGLPVQLTIMNAMMQKSILSAGYLVSSALCERLIEPDLASIQNTMRGEKLVILAHKK